MPGSVCLAPNAPNAPEKQDRDRLIVSREIGRLLGQNTRASHLFERKKWCEKKIAIPIFFHSQRELLGSWANIIARLLASCAALN